MEYSPEQATVPYRSKDGREKKTYDALEWLVAMACHVPERGKQTLPLLWVLRQLCKTETAQAATRGAHPHPAGAANLL
jgi:hypothetical protein